MRITEADIRKQVRRLKVVFGSKKPEDQIIEGWKWILMDDSAAVTPSELISAVREYASSESRFFPTPGQLLELIKAKRSPAAYDGQGKGQDPMLQCPTCGAKVRVLAPEEQVWFVWSEKENAFENILPEAKAPRLGILHDFKAHRNEGAEIIGGYRR